MFDTYRLRKILDRRHKDGVIRLKPGEVWGWPKTDGFKTIGTHPQVMNILSTYVENICAWYDGTMRPMRGHHGDCQWYFDGQIWWHQ